ncbi:MAG: CCA tRNA nucleotidyltransferase, partial [Candidatus Stahlbacteria bacterium]|nr:CCA tRNA nucleotidyltransferase [Candidatus Stahlbacteria bacterium]
MVEYKTLLQEQLNPFMPYLLKAEEIWLVGGAIRDAVLGVQVKDFDFALKDNASDFARQFANEINGTYVLLDAKNDESRVVYKNQIVFDFIHIETIENDLARRDFRINAMAMRLPCFELVDPYGGLKDIERKRIKMVSESALVADPLRILRGFRFKATLGFKIEVNTLKALAKYKELLPNVAPERIHYELFTLLDSPNSYKTLRQMTRYGVLQTIIPVIRLMEDVP